MKEISFSPKRRQFSDMWNYKMWSGADVFCAVSCQDVIDHCHSDVKFFDIATARNGSELT